MKIKFVIHSYYYLVVFLFYKRNRKWVFLWLCGPMQTLGEGGRTLKWLCKHSTFGLGRTQQLSSTPNLILVFESGYINTAKPFLFLNYKRSTRMRNLHEESYKVMNKVIKSYTLMSLCHTDTLFRLIFTSIWGRYSNVWTQTFSTSITKANFLIFANKNKQNFSDLKINVYNQETKLGNSFRHLRIIFIEDLYPLRITSLQR